MDLVIGLDVGTSGAKALAVDAGGGVVARAKAAFTKPPYTPAPGLAEQDSDQWWEASKLCLKEICHQVGDRVLALAVDSTSGTFVPVSREGNPLMPGLMYNDARAGGLEREVNEAARDLVERLGYRFPAVFSLVKMVWLLRKRPDVVGAAYKFLHAADFLVGKLTGNFNCTDTSNALKSGVDLISGKWPEFIEKDLGLPLSKFPKVFRPGEKLAEVSRAISGLTGLKAGTAVLAGASDGTASFLASGATGMGDWNLNLGTTLAIRGISERLIKDREGRFYCHRHPEGYWMPGGASNVGGEALADRFSDRPLCKLDQEAAPYIPTGLVVYPLNRKGERMPFVSSSAEGFVLGEARNEMELYGAYLEGISLITVWSIGEAEKIGADVSGEYFLSGGGGRGKTLARLTASALGKRLLRSEEPDAAMGSALLAASWAWYNGSVRAAQASMVRRKDLFDPIPEMEEPLREKLEVLKRECHRRGYL